MKAEKYKHTKEENKNLTFASNYTIKMFTVPCNNYVAHIWSWWHFSNWVKVLPIFLVGQNLVSFSHFSFRHVRLPCHLTLFYSGWVFGNFCGNFQFYFLSSVMTVIVDSHLPEQRILSWSSFCLLSVNFLRLHNTQLASNQSSSSAVLRRFLNRGTVGSAVPLWLVHFSFFHHHYHASGLCSGHIHQDENRRVWQRK